MSVTAAASAACTSISTGSGHLSRGRRARPSPADVDAAVSRARSASLRALSSSDCSASLSAVTAWMRCSSRETWVGSGTAGRQFQFSGYSSLATFKQLRPTHNTVPHVSCQALPYCVCKFSSALVGALSQPGALSAEKPAADEASARAACRLCWSRTWPSACSSFSLRRCDSAVRRAAVASTPSSADSRPLDSSTATAHNTAAGTCVGCCCALCVHKGRFCCVHSCLNHKPFLLHGNNTITALLVRASRHATYAAQAGLLTDMLAAARQQCLAVPLSLAFSAASAAWSPERPRNSSNSARSLEASACRAAEVVQRLLLSLTSDQSPCTACVSAPALCSILAGQLELIKQLHPHTLTPSRRGLPGWHRVHHVPLPAGAAGR